MSDFLKGINVGDPLRICTKTGEYLDEVIKVTAKTVHTYSSKYSKATGKRCGHIDRNGWWTAIATKAMPEDIERLTCYRPKEKTND